MAVWAQPEVGLLGGRGCHRRLMEQSAAERKHLPASAVGQPAEVADAREASGQYMLEEASQELLRRERHGALLAAIRIVLPPEGDLGVGDCLQPVVGDGDAVRVTGQVVEDVLGAAEGRLGVDDPVLLEEHAQEGDEVLLLAERQALADQPQLISMERSLEPGHELAAKEAAKHLDRPPETRARSDQGRSVSW